VHEFAGCASIAIVCAGTIVGMALITTAIGAPLILASRIAHFHNIPVAGSGLLSFGFGLFLAYQIGVVDYLFGSVSRLAPAETDSHQPRRALR
jgi:high-affinity nickel-transport protein